MDTLALFVTGIIMFIGLAGTLLPLVPGVPLIAFGIILYGFFTGFAGFSWSAVVLVVGLTLLGLTVDYGASYLGVRRFKAGTFGIIGALAGLVIGPFVMGPAGILLGPFLGSVGGEMLAGRELGGALRVGFGSLLGLLGGAVLKFVTGVALILIFLFQII